MASPLEELSAGLAGSYAIERELGRGGMATVYLARELKHDRMVAIKVLKPDVAQSVGVARFLREIRLTAGLDHPHILALIDSGTANGALYYVMPHVEGETLRDRLRREKQLPLEEALDICRQVADALTYAHGRGVMHRDIKPENILLAGKHARVADFGIARAMTPPAEESITHTGLVFGTPAYMSPEQASGERELDARTDVYSLACVLFEMLVGQPPFVGATAEAILARKSIEPVPSIRVVRDTIPAGLEAAIAKGLARVPADRFASAREFTDALQRGRADADASRPRLPTAPRKWLAAAVIALVAFGAWWGVAQLQPDAPRISSLVVLPLANLSGDPAQEFFADGVHDALIGELGRIAALRVISRTSAMRYKTTTQSVSEIARELGVDALVTGTVLRAGDSIRVQVELISASPERRLWGDTYRGVFGDAPLLVARSTEAISAQVEARLTRGERARLAKPKAVDALAYEHLLRGQYQLRLNRLAEARASFQQALARDSAYAQAYAGLAHTYNTMGYYSSVEPKDIYPHARSAALAALRLDENLPEGHVQLAWVLAVHDWDWAGAERGLRRALALNPGSSLSRMWYAFYLHWQLRSSESVAEIEKAIEIDPLSLLARASGASLLRRVQRCDLALKHIAKAKELEGELRVNRPGYVAPEFTAGQCLLQQGRTDEGLRRMEQVVRTAVPDLLPRYKAELAHAYGISGRRDDAEALLREVLSMRERQYVAPYLVALGYAGMAQSDSAFAWLERAYAVRDNWLPFLNVDPGWEPIRSDPRFAALLRRIRLAR